MTDAHETLLKLLEIEQLEVDLFRGTGQGGETSTRIFGGQVIGQALAAAYGTVPDRLCHSLHAYFIRPGDPEIPVIYQVDRARDGGSFTTRRVVAIQHGKQILNMSASFHVEEEGRHHQHPMPQVLGPENWPDRNKLRADELDRVPESRRADFMRPRPIELHDVEPRDLFEPEVVSDENQSWFRMAAAKGSSPQMQQCLLAYASDMNLLGSSLRPHGLTWMNGKVMTASLDHAMWFHAPVEFENWHLYTMDSPWTGGARGFNRGSIYNQDGVLVASTAQEGLMREIKPRK
ncbi:acyl-CoA thioesterase [Pseudosulfitobacter koreensis]|uniref:Acyl-CoA thioesterase II n=1 Tax=Pseudosulfitobacter koreensis TaxID=2968472 RepID=A0ABT1Z082_9RHOB|nr:acyl-CoA thioesterase II [Pseudosulfitobacter koreense]MCR8826547.1 acyl-CoA thioesterase II [Pseudosulfitobacter koreense]